MHADANFKEMHMNSWGTFIWFGWLLGCMEKENTNNQDQAPDSGIVVGPPPEPSNTDTNAEIDDTAEEDTAIADTAIDDTGTEDTAEEDTAIADTAIEDTGIEAEQMANFSLPDVNPFSATLGTTITARDQLQKISGWYFIKAT